MEHCKMRLKNPPVRSARWSAALVPAVLGLLMVSSNLPAQHSSVRGWGEWSFDTRGRDGFVLDVTASVYMSAVLTADGRIYTNGANYYGHIAVPSLPVGRR